MAQATVSPRARDRYGATSRRDAWWRPQLLTIIGLGAFIAYATWAASQGGDYRYDTYLSPFYSPEVLGADGWFGDFPGWWPTLLATPALLILPIPIFFRTTCYYLRRAYYRGFFSDPPACAVGEPGRSYKGETRFFIFQNLHRFAFYLAALYIVILVYDVFEAFRLDEGIGFGLGTALTILDVSLVTLYTLSCHSCRHLVGGGVKSFSRARMGMLRYRLWRGVTAINDRHMIFFWTSLSTVVLTDLYIRLLAMGVISSDPRIGG